MSPRSNGSSRLCFRLQDGSSLKEQFDTKQTCALQPAAQPTNHFNFLPTHLCSTCSIGDLFQWLDSRLPSRCDPCMPTTLARTTLTPRVS